jgi:hypothetical protein
VKQYRNVIIRVAGVALALGLGIPVWAGRIHRAGDTAYEISRIVSQYQGGTTETIGANETVPSAPIGGETAFFGWANRFPEFGEVSTFRPGEGWRKLDPSQFSFKAEPVSSGAGSGLLVSVVFRFSASQVALIQNAFVQFRVQPQPPGPFGDNLEGLALRAQSR